MTLASVFLFGISQPGILRVLVVCVNEFREYWSLFSDYKYQTTVSSCKIFEWEYEPIEKNKSIVYKILSWKHENLNILKSCLKISLKL